MQNGWSGGGNRRANERVGTFLCFYNFAKLQFSEMQEGRYGVFQGFGLIMPLVLNGLFELTNKVLYRKVRLM